MTQKMDNSLQNIEVCTAAHQQVAVFDLSDRTQLEITGSDRVRFLHSFTSNDIKRLKPGQGCETFITNLKGKVVAHVFVFCAENSLWLDGTPGQQEIIRSHLGQFLLIDDVQIIPQSTERGELFVTGPLAAPLLQLDESFVVGSHVRRGSEGNILDLRRVDLLGKPGFLLSTARSRIETVNQSLSAIGVVHGSADLFEALRVEAGFPRFGIDMTDDNLAQEVARTKQCISFDKGCYLGQETIARLDSLGHTNRELRRLRFDADQIPAASTPLLDATGTTEAGFLTSVAKASPDSKNSAEHTVVGIGMLKRAFYQPDTIVSYRCGDQHVTGRVLSPTV